MSNAGSVQRVRLAVLVAALGYFVDIHDLLLFNIIRLTSLKSLGITGDEALKQSVFSSTRGAVVPMSLGFQALEPALGVPGSAVAVGVAALALSFLGLRGIEETHGKDLDFLEE